LRCDEEIAAYHEKAEAASRAGKASAAKRTSNKRSTNVEQTPNVSSTGDEPSSTNQEPRTKNHKPKKIKNTAPLGELFPGVSEQVLEDFEAVRKKLRAEITKTAADGIAREAAKAGIALEDALRMCCERGWRGFKAEWVSSQPARASPTATSSIDKHREIAEALTGRNHGNQQPFIDIN
jgi:hypothetical protein